MRWYIYALVDARDGQVRYVGCTINTKRRVAHHLCPANLAEDSPKNHWLKSLLADGLKPSIRVLEEAEGDVWPEAEQRQIRLHREMGCDLTNRTDGGKGAHGVKMLPRSPESRERSRLVASKLSDDDALSIRIRCDAGEKVSSLAEEYGVSVATVSNVVCGKFYSHVGGPISTTDLRSRAMVKTVSEAGRQSWAEARRGSNCPLSHLTDDDAYQIRTLYASGVSTGDLARRFELNRTTVLSILKGRTWKHVPMIPFVKHPPPVRLTDEQVRQIRARYARGEMQKDIARSLGTSQSNISAIVTGTNRDNVI